MSDLIDVLSERGLRTGEILPRTEIHCLGKRHRVVRLYLFNARNELLLQRRAMTVDHAPNVFSISVLGHINAGEFSGQTVRREIQEELGFDASHLQIDFLFSHYQEAIVSETYIDRQFNDIYRTRVDICFIQQCIPFKWQKRSVRANYPSVQGRATSDDSARR